MNLNLTETSDKINKSENGSENFLGVLTPKLWERVIRCYGCEPHPTETLSGWKIR